MFGLIAQASAATLSAGTEIRAVASATYIPAGYTQTETVFSAPVISVMAAVEALTLTQDQTVVRPPNAPLTLTHVLTNTGNVTSTYTLNWSNGGGSCAASALALSSLRLVRDTNNNGVADAGEPVLSVNTSGALTLAAGQTAVLLAQGTVPNVVSGSACLTLSAKTDAQGLTATNQDTVSVGTAAALVLTESAAYSGAVVPGSARIDFTVTGTSIGNQSVQPTSAALPGPTSILVNGASASMILVRESIPMGTQYVAGSLQSSLPGVQRLFRLPADPPFSYRTGADDAPAIEVAIGIPAASTLANGAQVQMTFGVMVASTASSDIVSVAQASYNDGAAVAGAVSNTIVIPLQPATLALSESIGTPIVNAGANGNPDGTFDVPITLHLKNAGSVWLYDAQIVDALEGPGGAGNTQFGTYTSAAKPGVNQYTLIPGSVQLSQASGNIGGTVLAVNSAYTGAAGQSNLLAPGAVLPPGADATVLYTLRFNATGRPSPLLNNVSAQAALVQGGAAVVTSSATASISTLQPQLTITQTTGLPRPISPGVFELDYTIRVANGGAAPAPNVRVYDNLDCTFNMGTDTGRVSQWQLVSPIQVANGVLVPAAGFTGKGTCGASTGSGTGASAMPTAIALSLVDGAHGLAPNQQEQITFTVRVTEKPSFIGTRVTAVNTTWAVSYSENTINAGTLATVAAAATSAVTTTLVDPQGTVYDSVTRQPIPGAVITVNRQSCTGGSAQTNTIAPSELANGFSTAYSYNPDGSVSMTTDAQGAWQFYWLSPPVTGKCTYTLKVTPPSGKGYVYPSQRLPAATGTFATCGAIVPNSTSPQAADPTLYYLSIASGFNSDGTACDVVHDHIPVDPVSTSTGLVLRMDGSKSQIDFGDFLDYALTVTNKTTAQINGVTFNDSLPPGFAYVGSSARLNGASTADPNGGAGPRLVWSFPALQLSANASAVVRFRVRVGVGARSDSTATNRAIANSMSPVLASNEATHTVRVNGGVFSNDAFAFGKVYMDCNRDRMQQGADELGVPGVRLWLEDGTNVVTDSEGKWSLYGLRPQTHVLRLDETTLPVDAVVELQDNRNAGNPASRFLDLKNGELQKGNFPLIGCDNANTMREVNARRKLAAKRADADGQAIVAARLDPRGQAVVQGDTRGLPAAGQLNGDGAVSSLVPAAGALIALPATSNSTSSATNSFLNGSAGATGMAGTLGQAQQGGTLNAPQAGVVPETASVNRPLTDASPHAQPLNARPVLEVPAAAAGSSIDLEQLLPQLDNTPGFVELKDHDTVLTRTLNIRVKGPAGSVLQLSVNGKAIDGRRVGKKATLGKTGTTAWEYIGVVLEPGENQLRLEVRDEFGNARGEAQLIRVTAPDKLGAIVVEVPTDAHADLRTPVAIKVRLADEAGVPVTARTQVTLEADAGRWVEDDLNPNEPGLQAFVSGGEAVFHLIPPGVPGDVRVRVSAAALVQEVRLTLLPDLRPMIAVGLVEGTLDLSHRGQLSIGQIPAGAAFEQELNAVGNGDADKRLGARTAFFLKGAIKGEYLLTAALDTGKSSQQRLFRDIRPDEFYPIYGDSSVRGYDAQSSQRLYVRIDKNRSYLLYGDFTTASSAEVRKLSQVNRTLTGIKHVYQDEHARITSYASRTAQTQQVEEFPARGISGPYYLGGTGDLVENSEQVEILVRDRNQPNFILQRTPAVRFVDYTIEPLSRRLLFTRAIASTDGNLNPQSIRVTYEIDNGGPKYTVAGTDAQFKVGERVQIGVVANTDGDPQNRRELLAVTGLARVGEHTSMATEVVRTNSDLNGVGSAARVEVLHRDEKLGVSAQATRSTLGFDNPGAGFAAGRMEANARAEYALNPSTTARAEALYSKDASTQGTTRGATVGLLKRWNDMLSGEVGLRYGVTSSTGTASVFNYNQVSSYNGAFGANQAGSSVTGLGAVANGLSTVNTSENGLTTVRGRLTATVPNVPQAQVFVEGEQDLREGNRHMAAVGGNYAVTDKTRLYGRYEPVSSLYSFTNQQVTRNTGIFGVESNYMEGGRVYNEYRLADAMDGRAAQAALGVRNTVKVDEHWRVTGGIERTRAIGEAAANGSVNGLGDSTAVVSGVEYSDDRLRASAVLEGRHGSDANTLLSNFGFALKLDPDWSLLARSTYTASRGNGVQEGNEQTLARQQIGIAYRPVNQDVWNALARYEHRSEKIRGSLTTSGAISGGAFGSSESLPGDYEAHIVSVHVNVNPHAGDAISGRLAAKVATQDDGTLKSTYAAQLLYARWTHDLSKRWDVGVQGGLLHGSGGALQKSLGVEVGYLLMKDLWVGVGFNFIGLSDRDLTAGEYTSRGVYARLRFKFDETTLGFPSTTRDAAVQANRTDAPKSARDGADAVTVLRAETLFDKGQASFSGEGQAKLNALLPDLMQARYLVDVGAATTDSSRTDAARAVMAQRITLVQRYLIDHGVDAGRVFVVGNEGWDPGNGMAAMERDGTKHRMVIDVAGAAE